jgi:hypothetical protein
MIFRRAMRAVRNLVALIKSDKRIVRVGVTDGRGQRMNRQSSAMNFDFAEKLKAGKVRRALLGVRLGWTIKTTSGQAKPRLPRSTQGI